jgi:hypothetical protein
MAFLILKEHGRVFATHIAHEGNPAHSELTEFAARRGPVFFGREPLICQSNLDNRRHTFGSRTIFTRI